MGGDNKDNREVVGQEGGTKIITEGSAQMAIPANEQKASVFYNPVQVQNRDLSILMITLASERHAIRRAVRNKKQELKREQKQQQQQQQQQGKGNQETEKDTAANDAHVEQTSTAAKYENDTNNNPKRNNNLQEMLNEYEASLDGSKLVQEQTNEVDGLTILEALAASGLRSVRYWKEVPGIKHICINDLDAAAVQRAHDNVKRNQLEHVMIRSADNCGGADNGDKNDPRPYGIRVQHGDAIVEMHTSRRPQALLRTPDHPTQPPSYFDVLKPQYDVIDLDPYGGAHLFLDSAVQAVSDGGMVCCTCTDMRALGGAQLEACYGRYGAIPIGRAGYLQECAVRILLYTMAVTAARYSRTIKPILSVGMDFYIRVFVEIRDDKAGVAKLSLQTGHVYQSTQCPSFHVRSSGQLGGKNGNVYQAGRAPDLLHCEESGSSFKVGGPIWLGPLHDFDVIDQALNRLDSCDDVDNGSIYPNMKLLKTRERLQGLLESCRDELNDVPLFYRAQDLSQTLGVGVPPMKQIQAALLNAGYKVSGYHKEPQAVKTNAPNSVVWDIMRAWCKQNPPKKASAEGSVAAKILAKDPSIEVDFTIPQSLLQQKKKGSGVARFPQNPEAHWGPKPKASGHRVDNNKKRKAENDPS